MRNCMAGSSKSYYYCIINSKVIDHTRTLPQEGRRRGAKKEVVVSRCAHPSSQRVSVHVIILIESSIVD